MIQEKRVGVLLGGTSSERKISLKSGQAVLTALHRSGCHVIPLDIATEDEDKVRRLLSEANVDVAFIALHGHFGEDGGIQSILEELEIPYTGSGVESSRLAMDKVRVQQLLLEHNIAVPKFVAVSRKSGPEIQTIVQQLGDFPYVVKPSNEGSSVGVAFVNNEKELAEGIEEALQYGDSVLVDLCVQGGREMTVGILNEKALPVIEICPKRCYFDFTAKYTKGMTDYVVPADISVVLSERLRRTAEAVHQLVGCRMLSRVDFMVDRNGEPLVLEINTIPGFTETSLLPKAAANMGISFEKLCLTLIELAYAKKKEIENIACHS